MQYELISPPRPLADYVRYCWRLENQTGSVPLDTLNVVADGCPGILYAQSGEIHRSGRQLPPIILYGQSVEPTRLELTGRFTKLAVDRGVRQLVLLSGRGEPEAQACEQIVQDAGVDWTILQSSWFSQNFSEGYLIDPILEGFVALPVGSVPEPFIDVDDIADVAVAALTEEGHNGQVYELTGPRLLTFEEVIGTIASVTGRSIEFQTLPIDVYASALVEHGVPSAYVDLLTHLFTETLDGRNAHVADGVERALERTPTDFSDYAQKTAAAGVWNQVAA